MQKQTQWRRSLCTSAGRMTRILSHVAEAFPPARQVTILNNYRVIGIATHTLLVNGANLLLCDQPDCDSRGGAAGCNLL